MNVHLRDYFNDKCTEICKTTEPGEIVAVTIAFLIVFVAVIILTILAPIAMGILTAIGLMVWGVCKLFGSAHDRYLAWVTEKCEECKVAVRYTAHESRQASILHARTDEVSD